MRNPRYPVQMLIDDEQYVVLCNDGTIWRTTSDGRRNASNNLVYDNFRWEQIPHGPIPESEAAERATGVLPPV